MQHVMSIYLDNELRNSDAEDKLNGLVASTGKTKNYHICRAIQEYLEKVDE